MYELAEVDGVEFADTLNRFNAMDPYFPPLQERHFTDGYWWLAGKAGDYVAFAGLVPFDPFLGYGYLKRCLIRPDHYGHGLQFRLMCARELKARQLGWTHLVSECLESNTYSAANFRKAGFEPFEPEQKWGEPNSIYWIRKL